jgi:hypothetical protein
MKTKGQRLPHGSTYHIPWLLLTGLSCLAVATGYAQINYLSASGSASAFGSANGGRVPQDYQLVSYSGDWSSSTSTNVPGSSSFALGVSGTASASFSGIPPNAPSGTNSVSWYNSASVGCSTTADKLQCSAAALSYWGNVINPSGWGSGYVFGNASSSGSVRFSVPGPVDCNISWSYNEWPGSASLSSSSRGLIWTSSFAVGGYGYPAPYAGTLEPGDIYTLSFASSYGSFPPFSGYLEWENINLVLAVPEPSTIPLALAGAVVFVLRRMWRPRVSGALLPVVNRP